MTFGGRNVPRRPNHPATGVIFGLPEPVEGPYEVFQLRESRFRLFKALKERRSLIFSILTGVVLPTFGSRNVPRRPNHPAQVSSPVFLNLSKDLAKCFSRVSRVFDFFRPSMKEEVLFSRFLEAFFNRLLVLETYYQDLTTQPQVSSLVVMKSLIDLAKCFSRVNRVFDFYRPKTIEEVLFSRF